MPNASRMRHRFNLYRPSPDDPGTLGEPLPPVAAGSVRGELSFLTGRELYAAKQFNAETTHKLALRYLAGVDATFTAHDATDTGVTFQVLYVEQDIYRRFTNLFVRVTSTLPIEEGTC